MRGFGGAIIDGVSRKRTTTTVASETIVDALDEPTEYMQLIFAQETEWVSTDDKSEKKLNTTENTRRKKESEEFERRINVNKT